MGRDQSRSGGNKPPGGHRRVDRGRGYKRVSQSHVEVYDLDMAAYIHMHNVPIAEASKMGREMVIVFLDPEDKDVIHDLTIQYVNSESAKFSAHIRQLKKVALSTQRNLPPRRS